MFVNVRASSGGNVVYELNPYDAAAGTLKGLGYTYQPDPNGILPDPAALGPTEVYVDELVYEMHPSSSGLTGEDETFHFALATGRYKDNRIPPMGFRIDEAAARLADPVWHGVSDPGYFTPQEYAGGYDEVSLTIPAGADYVEVNLYYQTTSREYIEFLRDEINGNSANLTLPASAYIVQTDPFFTQLRAWGDAIWNLWSHNMNDPGAAPIQMTQSTWETGGGACYTLTTAASPSVGGSVSADPPPNCNNGTQYTQGTVVALTAISNSGYTFNSWTGDITDMANPVSVTMDGDKTITANFDPICFTLTLSVEPVYGGNVAADSLPDCTGGEQYSQGSVVELSFASNQGYDFAGWSGDAGGSSSPTSVTMDADKQVAANFDLMPGWSPLSVKSISVELSGSAPTTAAVHIDGTLRDSCTEFSHALQVRSGNHVEMQVLTSRPLRAVCKVMPRPFSTTVPLEGDFPPDHYTLSVNGVVEHFGMPPP
jgi:uncharacterized repeat protein (TIGR02543 family)